MKTMTFKSPREFQAWLAKNHGRSEGIWLRIYKKDSGVATVTYAEALDQALCHGWIDGQKQPGDTQSWLQKFTPRRPKSGWSKNNTKHAERLITSGEMTPDAFGSATMPDDFVKKLAKNEKANAFFATLNKTNLYSIAYRLQTAKKPETRDKRMQAIIEMLARGEKFH
jgi:uncharacterized protein YdeI (YjbR/CyaY-like superfamily)